MITKIAGLVVVVTIAQIIAALIGAGELHQAVFAIGSGVAYLQTAFG